jgi:hypothetical protein
MTLREIIRNLETVSDELVIFATKVDENWLLDARAALVLDEDMDKLGVSLEDLTYFLEVYIAKETLEVWSKWRGREPLESEREEAVVYYATNDAWLPGASELETN